MLRREFPLIPKRPGGPLRVIIIGRISTKEQNLESIDASYRYVQNFLENIYKGPMEFRCLGERASGMLADRATIRQAEDLIEAGEWDLVIAEDLSRIYRNPRHQYAFVQDVADSETRLICIADNIDTADDATWQPMLAAATMRHGLQVHDTQRRVSRSATYSFHEGGMVQKVRFGYRKLTDEEAATGQFGPKGVPMAKVPELTPVIHEMRRRFLLNRNYEAVARWLESSVINPGPFVQNGRWTGRLVKDLFADPILSGTRTFGDEPSKIIFKTGKKRRRASDGSEIEYHAELAHMTLDEQRELWEVMEDKAGKHRRKKGRDHARHHVARAQSLWPGQHARCICGGLMYWYDNDHLKCENSYKPGRDQCWNHVQMPCNLARKELAHWLVEYLKSRPPYWDALIDSAWDAIQQVTRELRRGSDMSDYEIATLTKEAQNLTKAIRKGGKLDSLVKELTEIERQLKRLKLEQAGETADDSLDAINITKQELRENAEPVLYLLAQKSFDFADLMRRAFPVFTIQPVRALGSRLVVARAHLVFQPSAFCAVNRADANGTADESVEVVFDVFTPPQHILHMPKCLEEKRNDPRASLRQIAARLKIGYMTVKRALAFARRMQAAGLSEPYQVLKSCPEDASRWRHRASHSLLSGADGSPAKIH